MNALAETFKDKLGNFAGREVTGFIAMCALIISWAGKQFFGYPDVPEFMFYTFGGIVSSSILGYSFEKKPSNGTNEQ